MGIGQAYVNVQLFCQKFFAFPLNFHPVESKLILHPGFNSLWKMRSWWLGNLGILSLFVYCVGHCVELQGNWKKYREIEAEDAMIHMMGIMATFQTLVTTYTIQKDISWQARHMNDILKVERVEHSPTLSLEKLLQVDFLELAGYGVASTLILGFPTIFMTYAVFRPYHPVERMCLHILPLIPRRILAVTCYGFISFFGACNCACFILLIMTCCYTYEKHTKLNLIRSLGRKLDQNSEQKYHINTNGKIGSMRLQRLLCSFHKWKFREENRNSHSNNFLSSTVKGRPPDIPRFSGFQKGSRKVIADLPETFRICLSYHNHLRILITECNQNMTIYIPALVGVAIGFCTIIWGVLVPLIRNVELIIVVAMGAVTGLCIQALIIFFFKHASRPATFSGRTIHFWMESRRHLGKISGKRTRAMKLIEFEMWSFCRLRNSTALTLMRIILDYTVTILLSNVFADHNS